VAEPTLSARALNRALLARQLLLERASSPIPKAVERIGTVQSQYAPAAYVGLRSRLEGFGRDDLTAALERKRVVQAWLMRSTIHIATPRDYWWCSAGVREARRLGWQRGFRREARDGAAAADRVARFLEDEGPRRRAEIVKALGLDSGTWYGAMLWVDLVRLPPSGTWERPRADLYDLAERWVGASPRVTEDEGIAHLVKRYLRAFGPAARADLASWSGVAPTRLAPVLERVRLRRFRAEDGTELLDVPGQPLPDPATPAPVRLVAAWDAMLLTHARRTEVLPERHRSRIFNAKSPHSFNTFLVDGHVAGTWRVEDGRVVTEAFERIPREVRAELAAETERILALWR
jgi:hypothetical protein